MQPIVSLTAVQKWYDEGAVRRHVLHGVDMHVHAGERVALVGKSGSGKSSLLNIISGIDGADAGSVLVGGHDLNGMDETARTHFRRTSIGFVFQFFNLVPTLTVGMLSPCSAAESPRLAVLPMPSCPTSL